MAAILQNLGARIGDRMRAWARRRQGKDAAAVTLDASRIYILPTKTGFLFGVIVFTMLLGAMNYNNNLGFALTFLLTGIATISMYHCQRNLKDLRLRFRAVDPVFAGQRLRFEFVLSNPDQAQRWQIRLGWDQQNAVYADLEPGAQTSVALPLTVSTRGLVSMPALHVSTRFPLGLFRAWSWVNMQQQALVYPRPAGGSHPVAAGADGPRATGRPETGDDDFAGLRSYRAGDPPRRIAWKALARSGEKLTKEYHGGLAAEIWIDWSHIAEPDTEKRIAILARQVLDAHAAGQRFGLRVPGTRLPAGHGPQHRHDCLKTLALLKAGPA